MIYAGGGVILADAAEELREFATHLAIPVAHTLMGKGALPDDHPLTLGMTGFWGTKFINDKCRTADWVLGLGTRFAEADCSSWDAEFTFSMPPTQADPHRHRSERDRPQLPGRDRRRRRPEGGARRRSTASPSGCCRKGRTNDELDQGDRRLPRRLQASATQEHVQSDALPDAARAHPRRRARGAAARRHPHHRRRLEQERRRPAVPDLHAGQRPDAGRLRDDGLRRTGGARRQARLPDKVVVALVGDGGFGQNPAMLATAVERTSRSSGWS